MKGIIIVIILIIILNLYFFLPKEEVKPNLELNISLDNNSEVIFEKCIEVGRKIPKDSNKKCCDGLIKILHSYGGVINIDDYYCVKEDSQPKGNCVGVGETWEAMNENNPYICCEGLIAVGPYKSLGYCVYK